MDLAGTGVKGFGGAGVGSLSGGAGAEATGGNSAEAAGGPGVLAFGGTGPLGGGNGVFVVGGEGSSDPAGSGIVARGGRSFGSAPGGLGLEVAGGVASGAGNRGGPAIFARGGLGLDGAVDGLAGDFEGDVEISGNLSKGGGSFKIDHPLDPENRYLYHSFVESPDMMNVYNGNVTTGPQGEAVVTLPDYFQALNKDFRYQLTVIGQFAQAIVASKVKDNRFTIRTDSPNVEVSWQVTGIRKDSWAEKNRIAVEAVKPERERGYFLHPEAFDLPREMSVEWARKPEMTKQMKELREKAAPKNR